MAILCFLFFSSIYFYSERPYGPEYWSFITAGRYMLSELYMSDYLSLFNKHRPHIYLLLSFYRYANVIVQNTIYMYFYCIIKNCPKVHVCRSFYKGSYHQSERCVIMHSYMLHLNKHITWCLLRLH